LPRTSSTFGMVIAAASCWTASSSVVLLPVANRVATSASVSASVYTETSRMPPL
jgi:hypothetical protein